jgi:hypothetical protein
MQVHRKKLKVEKGLKCFSPLPEGLLTIRIERGREKRQTDAAYYRHGWQVESPRSEASPQEENRPHGKTTCRR